MASQPLPPADGWGPFANLGFTEWILGAAWACGLVVAGFAWRLAMKVALIEQKIEERHKENKERGVEVLSAIATLRATFEAEMRQSRAQFDSLYRLLLRDRGEDR